MGKLAARVVRTRLAAGVVGAVVVVVFLACSVLPLGRSLWLDEAWVANAAHAPTIGEALYYDAWLQTSPPLFLILVRAAIPVLGRTNSAMRAVPLFMATVAVCAMVVLSRRLFRRWYAVLAVALFSLSPVAIEFAATLKQYSSELAASTGILLVSVLYLRRPSKRRFWLLVSTAILGIGLAYSIAFILPGIAVALCLRGKRSMRRAAILSAAAASAFCAEYLWVISPNYSSALHQFWQHADVGLTGVLSACSFTILQLLLSPDRLVHWWVPVTLVLGFIGASGLLLAWRRWQVGRRRWLEIQILCATPCLLSILSGYANWYPVTARAFLFLLPFGVTLLVCDLQLISGLFLISGDRFLRSSVIDWATVFQVLLALLLAIRSYSFPAIRPPTEDVDGAVSYLRANVHPNDLLWVHAGSLEGFKWYAGDWPWSGASVLFGSTGWPCCPRGVQFNGGASTEEAVRGDFAARIPSRFAGRVWLLYPTREVHWMFVGLDESLVMKMVLHQRGCTETTAQGFIGTGVSRFDCRGDR